MVGPLKKQEGRNDVTPVVLVVGMVGMVGMVVLVVHVGILP